MHAIIVPLETPDLTSTPASLATALLPMLRHDALCLVLALGHCAVRPWVTPADSTRRHSWGQEAATGNGRGTRTQVFVDTAACFLWSRWKAKAWTCQGWVCT